MIYVPRTRTYDNKTCKYWRSLRAAVSMPNEELALNMDTAKTCRAGQATPECLPPNINRGVFAQHSVLETQKEEQW